MSASEAALLAIRFRAAFVLDPSRRIATVNDPAVPAPPGLPCWDADPQTFMACAPT
jgi:hypothetical protein